MKSNKRLLSDLNAGSRPPIGRWLYLILPIVVLAASACSSKPPEELFTDNIGKMVLIDQALGFKEEISSIRVLDVIEHPDQVEVQVRVEGYATHPDVSIGAVLPAAPERKRGWALWTFYCLKSGDTWVIKEKYKVDEGFAG